MGRGADIQWESPFGTMMPAYYAMYARAHMAKYGTTSDDLALIRVKAATYAQINEKAVYRKPVTFEMFSDPDSPMSNPVASPLRVGDCCANADGAACVILAEGKKYCGIISTCRRNVRKRSSVSAAPKRSSKNILSNGQRAPERLFTWRDMRKPLP